MSLNITPQIPQVIVNAAAPTTEALQRTNAQKEVVPAPVQVEAAVPQKSREQDARPSNNSAAGDVTYNSILKNQGNVIPEDVNEQGQSQQQSQDQSQQQSQGQAQGQASGQGQSQSGESSSSEANPQANQQIDVADTDGEANNQADPNAEQAEQREQQQAEQRQKEQEQQERVEVRELEARDQEVRNHELAHAAVGGAYAGAPSYEYQTGPNGKKYAVGGEVQIDVSKEANPQDTIEKMQTVRAAALAPAEPSSQDRKVAAEASQNITEARMALLQENAEQREATAETVSSTFAERNETIERVAQVVASKYQTSYQGEPQSKSEFSAVA